MKTSTPILLLLGAGLCASCLDSSEPTDETPVEGSPTVTPTEELEISEVILNGFSRADDNTVRFSISAAELDGQLLTTGTITEPQVLDLEGTDPEGAALANLTTTASVCGDIVLEGPLSYVITFDASESMADNDPSHTRAEAASELLALLNPEDEVAIASFETCGAPTEPYKAIKLWQTFTTDRDATNQALWDAAYDGCGTNLWDASFDTASLMAEAIHSKHVALLLSDGIDTESQTTLEEAIERAQTFEMKTQIVGLTPSGDCTEINCQDLQSFAEQTGGLFALASAPEELSAIFEGMTNDAIAAGCIEITFWADGEIPFEGSQFSGTLEFRVDDTLFSLPFSLSL